MENKKPAVSEYLKAFLKYYVLMNFVLSFLAALLLFVTAEWRWLEIPVCWAVFALLGGWFMRRRKTKLTPAVWHVQLAALLLMCAIILFLGIVTKGSFIGDFAWAGLYPFFPFFPMMAILGIMNTPAVIYYALFGALAGNAFCAYFLVYRNALRKSLIIGTVCTLVGAAAGGITYLNRPEAKYGGHGFDYMHVWSSTDFKDYMPYSAPSKLVILDHEASLIIENEADFPVLDGAEACYPMYASLAKNTCWNIGEIEKKYTADRKYERENGRYVTFTNSVTGYYRLLSGEVDIFFGAGPSEKIRNIAKEEGKTLELIPIAKEAFVFFAEDKNPVDNLTYEEIRKIYSGEITNWKEVGGPDQEILAFQRPAESGSQIMMEYFMGDVPLKKPMTYEVFNSMGGIIDQVAQYHNEKGALGYTFRFFLEGLHQEDRVKMLKVDGVYPSVENIQNGSYPLVTNVYAVVLETNRKAYVRAFLDYILSPEGQEIVERSGYSPVK